MSWIDDPWMGFDTETTGVRALKHRLVTAALVLRIDGASYRSGVSAPDQVAT
ncbi:MAG: DNA polymerase III subunit epsilon, partial [Pauljensenia sp.]|nr:DNA polymerase III subunit epsilon [Pauljensenia sp.]